MLYQSINHRQYWQDITKITGHCPKFVPSFCIQRHPNLLSNGFNRHYSGAGFGTVHEAPSRRKLDDQGGQQDSSEGENRGQFQGSMILPRSVYSLTAHICFTGFDGLQRERIIRLQLKNANEQRNGEYKKLLLKLVRFFNRELSRGIQAKALGGQPESPAAPSSPPAPKTPPIHRIGCRPGP